MCNGLPCQKVAVWRMCRIFGRTHVPRCSGCQNWIIPRMGKVRGGDFIMGRHAPALLKIHSSCYHGAAQILHNAAFPLWFLSNTIHLSFKENEGCVVRDSSIQGLSQGRQVTIWPFQPLPPCHCDALCISGQCTAVQLSHPAAVTHCALVGNAVLCSSSATWWALQCCAEDEQQLCHLADLSSVWRHACHCLLGS